MSPEETSPSTSPRAIVFVCEDSHTQREWIAGVLRSQHQVRAFADAEALWEAAQQSCPDLIVCDIELPGMNGYALCDKVRSSELLRHVPFVLLTSRTDEDSRVLGLESGADDYLFKPVLSRELLARARSLIRLRSSVLQGEARQRELALANDQLKNAQNALIAAEKLAAIGTLVAGVAHEINNPLAFMKSGVQAIQEILEELPAMPESERPKARTEIADICADVLEGIERLRRISLDLRASTRQQSLQPEEFDLEEETRRVWKMASLQTDERPNFVVDFKAPIRLSTVRHQLGQALLNIFSNALQAMKGKGSVTVVAQLEGREARLSIKDTGPGISAEHLSRIFDPFFTTKPPGKGTGLGLSVSLGILQSLGGSLTVESALGAGAEFRIRLPLTPAGAAPALEPERWTSAAANEAAGG